MKMTTEFGKRVKAARKNAGLSQIALAREVGISQGTLSEMESMGHASTVTAQIASVCRVDANWLATGDGSMHSFGSSTLSELTGTPDFFETNGDKLTRAGDVGRARLVRVVGTARLGDNGTYEEVIAMQGEGVVEAYSEDLAAYAYKVRGESLYPAIRDGWILVVEPSTPAEPGDFVLLKLADGTTMVRELISQRHDAITVVTVNGETRTSYGLDELDPLSGMRAVSAIVSPKKWRPRA